MRALPAALFLAVLTIPTQAQADDTPALPEPMPSPHVRLSTSGWTLNGPTGNSFLVPQGSHIITAPIWEALDVELKRLQERETRLDAENQSFRDSADNWHPGWPLLAAALGVGLVTGVYVGTKF